MSGIDVTYTFTRCGRCKVQLEPAPFATELGEDDWGHEPPYCWSDADAEAEREHHLRFAAGLSQSAPRMLFPVEHVKLQYDGHTYKEVE